MKSLGKEKIEVHYYNDGSEEKRRKLFAPIQNVERLGTLKLNAIRKRGTRRTARSESSAGRQK